MGPALAQKAELRTPKAAREPPLRCRNVSK
jgi:hypothetical protein